jgi:hypothetical protein
VECKCLVTTIDEAIKIRACAIDDEREGAYCGSQCHPPNIVFAGGSVTGTGLGVLGGLGALLGWFRL